LNRSGNPANGHPLYQFLTEKGALMSSVSSHFLNFPAYAHRAGFNAGSTTRRLMPGKPPRFITDWTAQAIQPTATHGFARSVFCAFCAFLRLIRRAMTSLQTAPTDKRAGEIWQKNAQDSPKEIEATFSRLWD
jgi:hypothetical protein